MHNYKRTVSNPRMAIMQCENCGAKKTDRNGVYTYQEKDKPEQKVEPECISKRGVK